MNEERKPLYGFYSEEGKKVNLKCMSENVREDKGSSLWQDEQGGMVEVTYVTEDETGADYDWDDKIPCGKVVECVRPQCYSIITRRRPFSDLAALAPNSNG